jgi:hypothetical protein
MSVKRVTCSCDGRRQQNAGALVGDAVALAGGFMWSDRVTIGNFLRNLLHVLRILSQFLRHRHRKRRKLLRETFEKEHCLFGSLRAIMNSDLV